MIKFHKNNLRAKKIFLAIFLLLISSIVSIIINYRSLGVLKLAHRFLPIYSVDTKEKKIALTFDISLGDEDNTTEILDILHKHNVKAAFFLVGNWIDDNEKFVKQMAEEGHEIGNHSNKHPDMANTSKEKILQDVAGCEGKIIDLTGKPSRLFRFPGGAYNDDAVKTIEDAGYYCIQWNVDSIDWKEQGAEIEYNRIIKKTKEGSILLFHNTAKYTPENLPKIIYELKRQGYTFVTVSDLIYKNNFYIDAQGKQISK